MQTLNKPSQQKHMVIMRPPGRIFRSLHLFLILSLLLPVSGAQAQTPVTANISGAGFDLTANGEPAQDSTTATVDTVTNNDIVPVPYTMIDLGVLSGNSSKPVAINNAGQVIGNSDTTGSATHAVLWEGGLMIDLGTLGGRNSFAVAINEAGQVIGNSHRADGYTHAFLWEGGVMTDLGTLGGRDSVAVAINEAGQVIGNSRTDNINWHAFLWEDGVMTDLGTLGGTWSEAVAINEAGQVIGWAYLADHSRHAFVWQGGVMTDLTPISPAIAINDAGQIVGNTRVLVDKYYTVHAAMWEGGVMTDLGTLGGTRSTAVAINEAGHVIGSSDAPGPRPGIYDSHAFVWKDGVMTDMGTFGGPFSWPIAMNEAGQAIGISEISVNVRHAFVWDNEKMIDLGDLGGGYTTHPAAINEVGQVVGNSTTVDRQSHAFVWQGGVMIDLGTLGGNTSEAIAINEAGQVIGTSYLADGRKHAFLATPATNLEDPSIRCKENRRPDRGNDDPCQNGPSGGSQSTGKPISVVTGNMYLDQTDILIPTLGTDLDLVRSYNSQLAYRNIAGGFGPGWTHSYEQNLSFPSTGTIILRQGDGVPTHFQDMDADLTYDAWVPFNKESWIEKQANGTYIRRLRKGGYETYDSAGRLKSIVDAFGNTTALGRDGSHRLTSINSPGSRSLTLTYDASNRIETLSGPAGLIATYTYDDFSRLQKVTYADDRGFTFSYDTNHQLLTVSDLSGKVLETHTYSGNKAITSEISEGREKYTLAYSPLQTTVADALGNVTTYNWTNIWGMKYVTRITVPCPSCGASGSRTQQWTYDDKGRVRSYTDGNGKETTYDYDANGDLISETDPGKNLTTYEIGPDGRRTSMTVKSVVDPAQNKVTLYEYDRGKLKTQTEGGLLGDGTQYSYTTSYSYDSTGNLTSIDGPRTDVSDITTFDYNLQTGDLTTVTQPEVGTTSYSNFTPLGQPQTVTDPNGLVTTYKYDPQKRILSVAMGEDKTSYTYTPSGKLDTLTLPRRNTTTYVYDAFDWLMTIRDPLGNVIQYTYDLMGQTTKEEITDVNGGVQKWVSFEYDSLNQLKKIINPDSAFTEYGYDGAGNRTSLRTPRGHTTAYKYDSLNRLRATIQPGAVRTAYGYDTQSNLTSVTDANGHVTRYFYDDMGRVYREVSPDVGTTTYTYDEAGNRISKTDARGITIGYQYDALNRLIQIDFPADTDITYTYDTCENGKGRLCQIVDQSGTTSYSYDVKGQLIQENKSITGASGVYGTGYGYDSNGNLTSMTYPSGRKVTYAFDLADRVKSVSTTPAGGSLQRLASKITYQPFGGVSSFTYGNGLARTVSYDNQYRIASIQSGSVQRLTYAYDRNGNITAINNLVDPARNKAFKYDGLDRLRAATGSWGPLAWTYDGVGNRLTQTDSTGASTYTYKAGTNRLLSVSGSSPITFRYDLGGNTSRENARRYVYNQNGSLAVAQRGSTTLGVYTYNANGQRVKKRAGGATTVFHYDGQGQLIGETRPNGNLGAEYIHLNGQPLARVAGSTITYIHTDHLGTPVAMTNASRKKVWEIESRPFGEGATISGTATLNLRFPGQYFDQETGLHQNWFRDYVPRTGRYAQPDPIGLNGGLNFYSYTLANPLRFADSSGLKVCTQADWDAYQAALNDCFRQGNQPPVHVDLGGLVTEGVSTGAGQGLTGLGTALPKLGLRAIRGPWGAILGFILGAFLPNPDIGVDIDELPTSLMQRCEQVVPRPDCQCSDEP